MQSNTPVLALPLVDANSPTQYATTAATVDNTTVITLNLGRPFVKVGLVRFKMDHLAGGAASFQPIIFSKSGVTTAGDISMEFQGAATLVANIFDPQLADAPVVMQADANGRLYMMPVPNAGANNQFAYALRFIVYANG
jgi:hypothetical protein